MFDKFADGWVPDSLETMPPGCVLGAMLDDIDLDRCSGYDRIRVLRAHQRMVSHYQAKAYQAMTAIVDVIKQDPDEVDFAEQAAAAEVAAALRLTRRASDIELSYALELQRRLPRVWEALQEGSIDLRRARLLLDGTAHLATATARNAVDEIIADAGLLTSGQLSHRLRKLCIDADPDDAQQRYEHAVQDRRVVAEPDPSGTTNLFGMNLPPHRVAAAMKRVNHLAREQRGSGETRTMDQLRSDVLLDLIEGTGTAIRAGRGTVVIHVDLKTLTELSKAAGELAGYGPVIADIARQVAEHQRSSEWQWTLNDPDTGQPIDGGITRRRPTTSQRRMVQAKHRTCVHPGCRMPATACDIDHRIPWAERRCTDADNLAPLCRHHHVIRHRHGWTYRPTDSGDFEFTTPLGHTYTTSGRSP